ncbi:hypothetical protein BGZ57DRAFT_947371 [Hyaloscypha finlandica]|nr:hypothetical protein BGZ57DRAFT_947371 [Hyaloscypha finlandica]
MAVLKALLAAAFALPALSSRLTPRQSTSVSPLFCTEAAYPDGDPYGQPYGTGWCWGLPSELGTCYNWEDFPAAEDGPLGSNLTYVFIPGNFECDLYKTSDCTGKSYSARRGDNDLSNAMFGPTDFNKEVESWLCVSS